MTLYCAHKSKYLLRFFLAADIYREGSHAEAEKMYRQALAKTPSAYHRLILRLAYTYRRLGGKGAAQILRPFI